jgi:uncharacterized protein (TIGR03790 family)
MKKQLVGIFALIFAALSGFGQITNYDDVGVIVNDNSPVSIEIGEYFKLARNIPELNMIHIQTLTDEVIDTIEFRNIQYQIKNYILDNDLVDKLNYLVTTKGVPFDIAVDSCQIPTHSSVSDCSSVESELTLLFSSDSTKIIKRGTAYNPYFKDTTHMVNSNSDLLLVSRLDGKTKQDVFDLIDRSGPETYVNKEIGKFIFDVSFVEDTTLINLFSELMYPAIDTLSNLGWNTFFDTDFLIPTGEENVIGFVGLFQGIYEEPLDYGWEKGSFAELIISSPNVTFYDTSNYSNNIQLADLIQEGSTGGAAYVHPSFASLTTDYAILFGRYTKETGTPYNLAESFYMATKKLSWMNLLVGDPKTTLTTQGGSSIENLSAYSSFNMYPNPAHNFVKLCLNAEKSSQVSILIFDLMGKCWLHEKETLNEGRNEIEINMDQIQSGLYFVKLMDENNELLLTRKLMKYE